VLLLWFGWFGFNPGSTLNATTPDIASIAVTTLLAGAASTASSMIFSWARYGKPDVSLTLNGCLAGLVAITAGCDTVEPWAAICIGVIAGCVYSFFSKFILAMNIDDPLEAASVHYANGIWGILSCIIFDSNKGFVSGNPVMGEYLGV
jgi:Amt family ammonium transporter